VSPTDFQANQNETKLIGVLTKYSGYTSALMFCAFLLRDFMQYSIRDSTQCTFLRTTLTVDMITCGTTSLQLLVAVSCCVCERSKLLFTVRLHQGFHGIHVPRGVHFAYLKRYSLAIEGKYKFIHTYLFPNNIRISVYFI